MNRKAVLKEVLSWVKTLVFVVVLALLIDNFLIANAVVTSGSMEKTIMTGERVVGNRLQYDFETPKRGDVILFKFPDDETKIYVKRIIGLPGETLRIKDGKVYINESTQPLSETYLQVVPTGDYGPFQIPEGAYFMMGDNRNVSYDSRFWNNHFVQKDKILAKAAFGYYPKVYQIQ